MFTMFNQFWTMLTVLFSAGEKLAKTADNFAAYAEEGSESFLNEARARNSNELRQLKAQLEEEQPTLKSA